MLSAFTVSDSYCRKEENPRGFTGVWGRVEQSFLRLFLSKQWLFSSRKCGNPGKSPRVRGFLTITCEKCINVSKDENNTSLGEIESYTVQESLFGTVIPGYFLIFRVRGELNPR